MSINNYNIYIFIINNTSIFNIVREIVLDTYNINDIFRISNFFEKELKFFINIFTHFTKELSMRSIKFLWNFHTTFITIKKSFLTIFHMFLYFFFSISFITLRAIKDRIRAFFIMSLNWLRIIIFNFNF